jgi:hypothetical protein
MTRKNQYLARFFGPGEQPMNATFGTLALRSFGLLVLLVAACGDKDPATGGTGGAGTGGRGGSQGSGGQVAGTGGSGGGGTGSGGASDAAPGDTGQVSNSYFPFAVGNTWEYEVRESGLAPYRKVHHIVRPALVEGTGPHKAVMAFRVETRKTGGVGAADATISWQARDGNRIIRYREVSCTAGSVVMEGGTVSACTFDVEDHWNPPRMRIDERPMNAEPAMDVQWPETYTEFKSRYTYGIDPKNPTITTSMAMQTDTWKVVQAGITVNSAMGALSPCLVLLKTAPTTAAKTYTFCRGVGKVKEEGANQTETLLSYTVR